MKSFAKISRPILPIVIFCIGFLFCVPVSGLESNSNTGFIQFKKVTLTDKYYCDGVDAGDINGDGQIDIVAGPFWYSGPDFTSAHEFYPAVPLPTEKSPSNSMFSFVWDFDANSKPDILVLGRVHKHEAVWYENPGQEKGMWNRHFVFERVRGESPTLVDLEANGRPRILTHWTGRWGWLENMPSEPKRPWRFVPIGEDRQWPQFYHGEGVGDINGDGRLDVLINDGWYEHPEQSGGLWTFHEMRFSKQRGGAQMFTYDIDGDGDADVISSIHAHAWGLSWFEQKQKDGTIAFVEHRIMGNREEEQTFGVAFSQPHALEIADIDGDGNKDLICGKRRWAHGPTGDVEPSAEPVVYWFRLERAKSGVRFVPHLIDNQSGVGVQICAKDVNNDGRVDVMTASKLGTFLFLNQAALD